MSSGPPQLAGRFWRLLNYALELVLWSRIFAARKRRSRSLFDERQLTRKGVVTRPPQLTLQGPGDLPERFTTGFPRIYAMLLANLQPPNGPLTRFRHAQPGPAFHGVYLWDSAFIALVWRYWDPQVAREVIESVIDLRYEDRLQHVVSEFTSSPYTQPPLIAWSARKLAEAIEGPARLDFVRAFYPALVAYQGWLQRHRRLENGLYGWIHCYESGVENAPRFSNRDEAELYDTQGWAAPDFCAYVVLQLEALAWMATQLGESAQSRKFTGEAETLAAQTRAFLWHAQDGLFYDRHVQSKKWRRVDTIASLLPMAAGISDANQAHRLRDRAMDPDQYGTWMPLPSVSASSPHFEKDMWRGPVWLNTAYLVVEGLERGGYDDDAAQLGYRLSRGVIEVLHAEGDVFEFYDPQQPSIAELSRKRGNLWKALTLGTQPQRGFVGWSGLATTLFVEQVLGLKRVDGALVLKPRFPQEAIGWSGSLHLPVHAFTVTFEVHGGCRVGVRVPELELQAEVAPGERIVMDARALTN